ncbi:hypothetical protein [Streptomyces sp. SP18CS02]|uniref:hypothetical protein n=1 Tax=Streptomyces sp. SP18CS02 TaxID=3002531 RepID=UPI002E79909D|nr:hypothetical protein [Streptomyces sp. SP18CS02]MEE1753053.1 hypothetical protein [Streptomyces sp. SP18CS02]
MRAGWIRLGQWTACGGIALSLYAGWLTFDDIRDRASSERAISAACDRLVSGAAVMDLQGGMIRAEASDYHRFRLDVDELPGSCTVYKVPDSGKTTGLFTLTVRVSSTFTPLHWIGDDNDLEPFHDSPRRQRSDVTAIADRRPEPRPIGNGTLGRYGDWYTTIRAECDPGSRGTAPKLLNVTARADYDDVSAADRERLARIARSATAALTERIGCHSRLPALPDHRLPSVPSGLRPARATDGSCRWFARHIQEQGQGRLPDRALATPALDASPVESCLLAVGPDQVDRIDDGLPDDQHDSARSALTHSPWWLRTASFFGADAHAVGYDALGDGDTVITAGTAGHGSGAWWASSICDGKPALHTLSSSYTYDSVLGPQALTALLRAYVDDITKRRGCTHVTYPQAKDFRSP